MKVLIYLSIIPFLFQFSFLLPVYARNLPSTTTKAKPNLKPLSDQDILDPTRLVFDRVVPLLDSFDNTPIGFVFVSKRSVLGSPAVGVIGEKGSQSYNQHCLLFCPPNTSDIDATYFYLIEKKGECTIAMRGIGWSEKTEERRGGFFTGRVVETGRVTYTSTPTNISQITVNGKLVGPPINQAQLTGPHGTNYKYFPRKRNFLGQQTTADQGFITDIHYFPATEVVRAVKSGQNVVIQTPSWRPNRHEFMGESLVELKKLVDKCDSD